MFGEVPEAPSELDRVEAWRLHELLNAGYPITLAERLAAARNVDLHQARELLELGCPPELAAEILL